MGWRIGGDVWGTVWEYGARVGERGLVCLGAVRMIEEAGGALGVGAGAGERGRRSGSGSGGRGGRGGSGGSGASNREGGGEGRAAGDGKTGTGDHDRNGRGGGHESAREGDGGGEKDGTGKNTREGDGGQGDKRVPKDRAANPTNQPSSRPRARGIPAHSQWRWRIDDKLPPPISSLMTRLEWALDQTAPWYDQIAGWRGTSEMSPEDRYWSYAVGGSG